MRAESERLQLIRQWVRDTKAQSAVSGNQSSGNHAADAIAMTGLFGFFPGCMDVASFWSHIDRDESLITEIPEDRFDWRAYFDPSGQQAGSMRTKWGGYIPDIASFDPECFNILPMEADEMDPRLRLLLMSTWRTLEDASINPSALRKSNTGVFIGCEANEYAQLMARQGFVPHMVLSQADSMIANRISYQFDFSGPSELVNATCAGFAVALHRAVVALRAGLIDRAIVGAANIILLPDPFVALSKAEQLTAQKTVKSFGKDGDGFVRAEGVGTILIERLKDAESGNRSIYAVIKHTSVNFNGRGGVSIASPNIDAHVALVKSCYRETGIDPRQLTYLEAQGMGLPVADIAEWTAINRALKELCEEKALAFEPGFCRVSTLKPLAGHMHAASSLGALLKITRSFQTGKIHKILGFIEPNEFCDMQDTPCRIAEETELWPATNVPRLAAFHAYGSGGNNAHVLMEEYRGELRAKTDRQEKLEGRAFAKMRCWFQSDDQKKHRFSDKYDEDVLQAIKKALGLEEQSASLDAPFAEIGLDSVSIASFITKLESTFRVQIRKSDVFSHSNPRKLAQYVASLIRGAKGSNVPAKTPGQSWMSSHHAQHSVLGKDSQDIAIIGMSLRVSGADHHDDFWTLLREGRCAISTIPKGRPGVAAEDFPDIKGGFLSSIDTFDPLFFNLAPRECEAMDPRHRMLLEVAWSAIEDSGYNPDDWRGAEHGIFIGIEESDYPVSQQSSITSVHGGTAPARIGYFLDTKGPLLALSTACSSSLVAVHYACRSILDGESECALAGGCNIISQPDRTHFALSQMGDMLSPDGTCYAFDHRANGMVMGEGIGLIVLKRLSQAHRDGDSIYAVIKSSGINYDGKTNGLTAPSGARQRELYQRVYRQGGVRPDQISYVVAHGTGTVLGDPVECNALIDVYSSHSKKKQFCALTSPKTNIGHTQAAAGIVNLITAALALHNREIPPSLNFESANADISLDNSPFYVNTALKAWDEPERYAAVSSFGHTGTNAHVLLSGVEHSESVPQQPDEERPVMILLSAKNEERLRKAAANLLKQPVSNLRELAYTLQVGRQTMEERLGLAATTLEEMREKLSAYLEGRNDLTHLFQGSVEQEDEALSDFSEDEDFAGLIHSWLEKGKYVILLKMWVKGLVVDWNMLYGAEKPRRIHLPTYPFEKERFWLNADVLELAPRMVRQQRYDETKVTPSIAADTESSEIMTFDEVWQSAPLEGEASTELHTLVCILADTQKQKALTEELGFLAPKTTLIFVSEVTRSGYENALVRIGAAHGAVDAVLYLRPIEDESAIENPSIVLPLIQAMAASKLNAGRLILAGSFKNGLERCYVDAWIGFARSLRMILPKTKVSVMGMDISCSSEPGLMHCWASKLWAELQSSVSESVLHDDGQRLALRIQPTSLQLGPGVLKKGGTYLITGGCGGLGFLFAAHLAKAYSANLILTGRSSMDHEKHAQLDALKTSGGDAMYLQADVCDAAAMKAGIAEAKRCFGPINGVLHAAGIQDSRTILEKDEVAFQQVTDAKIKGTLILDQALQEEPLEFVVYFSSSAAILGDFGSCDYAIGNRFETAYAHHRNALRERGERAGKTVVFNWPLWKDGGMGAGQDEQAQFYLNTSGQRALEAGEGLILFEQLLSVDVTQHLVLVGKPAHVHQFLSLAETAHSRMDVFASGQGRRPEMKGFSLEDCVRWDLKEIVSQLLKISREKLKTGASFSDFGFHSISLAEFAEELSQHYSLDITPALFFGHSTLDKLCAFFLNEHGEKMHEFYAKQAEPEKTVRPPAISPQIRQVRSGQGPLSSRSAEPKIDEPIAIIGMSGRFPHARDINEMWDILAAGKNAVEEVPADRFDWRDYYGDPTSDTKKTNGKWGGFIPGFAEFDPLFFEISPREAEGMDPRQRLLLQEAWKALEDAGYGPRQLENHKVGMFVGVEEGDFAFLAREGDITANHSGILASRLAYFLDLRGPAMAINTACSSGLVAAHQACVSLRNNECHTAIVAGVNLMLTPAGLVTMGQSGMLSSDGKCFVFDKRANGMVPGEAVVVMVLKPLSKAEADGDPIHAVIRASGVNYDGKTNGITAPSGIAQTELFKTVYERAHLHLEEVEYIVTHGTGTKLGDPVEINALYNAFKSFTAKQGFCALTSTKTNFGHTFAASGLLSAVSLVKAFHHQVIPASLHCEEENDYITWEESPFFVNKTKRTWLRASERKRIGAVSAFGMSGTNCHMVFEDYLDEREADGERSPYYLLVLSAKTAEALREKVATMEKALQDEATVKEGLRRISYTLLEGRHHFRYRLAIVIQDIEDALFSWKLSGREEQRPNLFRGRVPLEFTGQKAIQKHAEELMRQCRSLTEDAGAFQEALCALADYYCQGYDLQWSLLFGDTPPPRISLPTYPFAPEKYLVSQVSEFSGGEESKGQLHPLLHRNTSDFSEQRFSSTFSGRECFLADHVLHDEKILPGVCLLEMAREAVEESVARDGKSAIVQLSNILWVRRIVVDVQGRDVHVGLVEKDGRIEFEVYTEDGDSMSVVHGKGLAAMVESARPPAIDLAGLQSRMTRGRLSPEQCYAAFKSAGLNYGSFYQGLQDLMIGDDEVLAFLSLPNGARQDRDSFVLHPSIMDSAFQATLGLEFSINVQSAPRIPFALEKIEIFGPCPEQVRVWVRRALANADGDKVERLDIDLCDQDGNIAVRIEGFSTRAMESGRIQDDASLFVHTLTGEEFFLKDHGGLLPGVVSLEWACASGVLADAREVRGLKNVIWNQPIRVHGMTLEVQTDLYYLGDSFSYRVSTGELVHAQGSIVLGDREDVSHEVVPIAGIQARCTSVMKGEEYNALLQADLGPSFLSIAQFRHHGSEALAALVLPDCVQEESEAYILHPSMMNGAIQTANILSMIETGSDNPFVPFSIDELWIHKRIPDKAYAYVTKSSESANRFAGARLSKYDIKLTNLQGEVAVSITGYAAITAPSVSDANMVYAVPRWQVQELETANVSHHAEMVSPVFILHEANGKLQQSVAEQWPDACIVTLAQTGDDLAESVQSNFLQVFQLMQECMRHKSTIIQPIVLLLSEQEQPHVHAAYAGLFKTARMEHAGINPKVIYYTPDKSGWIENLIPLLEAELSHSSRNIEIRYDATGSRQVKSIQEVELASTEKVLEVSENDVIWITGGFGGLGVLVARYYGVDRKARIILSGRSSLDEGKKSTLAALLKEGVKVRYLQGDVANREEVERIVSSILATEGRLNGIIHCAGVIEDAHILKKTTDAVIQVLQPKIAGVLELDEATRDIGLDFMVLFSSLTGTFGNAGQADYAAANAFLDSFAEARNKRVLNGNRSGRTLAVGWPLWREGGMGMDEQSEMLMKQSSGMTAMPTSFGIEVLNRALQSDCEHVLVIHGEVEKIRAKLFPVPMNQAASRTIEPLTEVTSALSFDKVCEQLIRIIGEQQKIPPEKIELEVELSQYGFNSLALTELANRLNQAFSLELMPTLFFEKSTLRSLASHLMERYPDQLLKKLSPVRSSLHSAALHKTQRSKRNRLYREPQIETHTKTGIYPPIAIVGMSGRFPGAADVDAFWRHVEANHDMVTEVSGDRWEWREYYGDPLEQPGKTRVKCAGFMDGVDQFDPAFFGISPREAIGLDPQLRLLMETIWSTIEDAGYRPHDLSGSRTGVFVGVSTSDYKDAWLRHAAIETDMEGPALVSHFVIANRISYVLDLRGPSEPIDTACSSSLIAIHRAIEGMRQGTCDSALVGGVNVISSPNITIGASRAGMLSEDGRCKTFDKSADGYGRGEGVGAIFLKPLDKALEDRDHIYGLIRGSSENHGGKATSPTAPNPIAQQELLVDAYSRAGIDPRTVSYIEAHGTGTKIGDAVEIDGLKGAFEALYKHEGVAVSEKHCGLGSVKTNVGHLEAAAGIAGIIKVIQMLRHQKIPGNVHLKEPNPFLQLEGSPFYLAQETKDWKPLLDENRNPLPRKAGVSSFGIGGSNAHVILEEYVQTGQEAENEEREAQHPVLITLSARNEDRLKVLAKNLLVYLHKVPGSAEPTLREVAHTLQVGREAMEERMGFVATTMEDLVEKLRIFVENGANNGVFHRSRVRRNGKMSINDPKEQGKTDLWFEQKNFSKLLEAWMQGKDIDWSQLYGDAPPRRISLPTYPFDRKRYWFTKEKHETNGAKPGNGVGNSIKPQDIALPSLSSAVPFKKDEPSKPPPADLVSSVISTDSIKEGLVSSLAEILYMEESDIDLDSPFIDMGLDSVIGVQWIQTINQRFGIKVPATKLYDHPNIRTFMVFLAETINKRGDVRAEERLPSSVSFALDEVLELVQRKALHVEEAEQLIEKLGLVE